MVIEVRPETQAEWVDALEMFAQKPELSVTVLAPKVETGIRQYTPEQSSLAPGETVAAIKGDPNFKNPDFSTVPFNNAATVPIVTKVEYPPGYDAIGPKADVDCPEPECDLSFGHSGEHHLFPSDCPKPDCNLLAGHKGKCVKKVAK